MLNVIIILSIRVFIVVLCVVFLVWRIAGKLGIFVLMIGLIGVLVLAYFVFLDDHCRGLRRHGFDYEITGGRSPTWDVVIFFFRTPQGKRVHGHYREGSRLKVRCRDIDGDGVAEFIVQSKVHKTDQTILQVDIESGSYHVHSTTRQEVDVIPDTP